MNREEDRELWDLLGKSAAPTLSPFFARDVVRAIREHPDWTERVRGWFRPRILAPLAAVAVLLASAALVANHSVRSDKRQVETIASIEPDGQDADLIADVDDLVVGDDDASAELAIL